MHRTVSCDAMNQVPEFPDQISPGCLVDRHPGIKGIILLHEHKHET
jgi:hypothetical protein